MKVARWKTRSGVRWVADSQTGLPKRLVKSFRTEEDAAACVAAWKRDCKILADQWIDLSEEDKVDACKALRVARRGRFTLLEAVEAYKRPSSKSRSIGDAVTLFLASRSSGYRAAYITHLATILNRFARGREQLSVSSLSSEDIVSFLNPSKYAPATIQGMRRRLAVFFAWCLKHGVIASNPMVTVEFARVSRSAPKILSVEQSERLMRCAEQDEPGFLRFLALALFCGIRPEEIRRLKDDDIKVGRGFVEIGSDASKVGARRLVSIPENARGWIARPGPLVPVGFWKRLRKLRSKAIVPWSCDILRHTAASMMLARDKDAASVALELGNSPEILFRHYRELVTNEEAVRFWSIRPTHER